MLEATGPNAEQITFWNTHGAKWAAEQTRLDRMIAQFGDAAMAALAVAPDERVLDVGCGCGYTTLALGRRVGDGGEVLGIDLSETRLARARERAAADGVRNVRFVAADAQSHAFPPARTDALFSRFGVMFFVDPAAAFANLRRALRPGGRLAFVCWQPLQVNAWMRVPLMAAAQVVQLPPPPAPDAPGPFSFGDRDRVHRILGAAGFRDVACEAFAPPITVGGGGDLDATVEFVLYAVGPTSAALRDAPPVVVAKAKMVVREALLPFATPQGVVMPSAAWIVSASS